MVDGERFARACLRDERPGGRAEGIDEVRLARRATGALERHCALDVLEGDLDVASLTLEGL